VDSRHYPNIRHFYLESNLATDKKASQVNIMHTRGKRVVAEAVIKRNVLIEHMRVEPESLFYHSNVSNVGAILSGANNNGAHSANGITAMFIATGQDVANVAESSAGIIYTEMTPERDLYISITIPSLIVATYGGGTGLATQRECLELLGCWGRGKVNRWRRSSPAWCWPARFRWRRPSRRRTGSPAMRSMAAIGDEWLIANGQLSIVNCQRPR
jgi:hydroxymethylglutaryl-CoA reductase (NADPH)